MSSERIVYEKFKIHRKHCRMKCSISLLPTIAYNHLLIHLLIQFVFICKLEAQIIIRQTNVQQASLNSKSLAIKNAYTVYPQVESLLNGDAYIPCNISHPVDDTLLMILIYYNPRINSSGTSQSKPIALTSGPPVLTLDLRLHTKYMHHYLHQNRVLDKFKHQIKRQITDPQYDTHLNSLSNLNSSNQLLNINNRLISPVRRSRDLDERKATELLTSAQFVSPAYADRLTFNFSTNREQFILKLSKLKEQDSGEFVCRADFKWTRTLISVVNLFVIVPSHQLYIENEQGIQFTNRIQYKEGDTLILNCVAIQGKPLAKVFWYLDRELIDDSYTQDNKTGHTVNQLLINDLRRKYDSTTLTCRAVNHPDLPPLVTSVQLQLYLKPLQVAIISNRTPLRTGKRISIQCETSGSRPSADVRWVLGKEKLADFRNIVSPDASKTISTLNLMVNANHDESLLYCIAENPMFSNSSIIDLWQLEVHYRPKPMLTLIDRTPKNKNQIDVLAGKSIQMRCDVQANPMAGEIRWLFNGSIVDQDFSIESNGGNTSILIVNRIDKSHTGIFECMSKNSEGIGRSNSFNLQVNYEPICLREEIFEANIGDSISINCSIDASPSNCSYRWNIPEQQLLRHSNQPNIQLLNDSTLLYKVNEQLDFGSVKCQATNTLGKITCEHFILPKSKIEIELPEDTSSFTSSKRCPDVIPLRVDTLDSGYINYNKPIQPMVDCLKKTNLVTFSNQKIELICSDDPINITLKNPYETTTYAYNEDGDFTLSTTV